MYVDYMDISIIYVGFKGRFSVLGAPEEDRVWLIKLDFRFATKPLKQ